MIKYTTHSGIKNPQKNKKYVRKHFITDVNADRAEKINPRIFWYKQGILKNINFRKSKSIFFPRGNEKSFRILPYGCAFDTEFYTYVKRDENNKILSANAYVYIWQFAIDDCVFLSRDLNDFKPFIIELIEKFKISEKNRMYLLIANSGCEFQFIKHIVNIKNCFMLDERNPLTFSIENEGLICLDAIKISNSSLKKIAENFTSTQKLTGDIDYKLSRHSKTPLTDNELNYCINDVVVLVEYFNYLKKMYLDNGYEIPTTSTGIIRKAVKERFYSDSKNKKIKKKCKLPQEMYNIIRNKMFRGGYTHSNVMHTGKTLEYVVGVDFTSSYPAVMLHEKYPMETPKKWVGDFNKLLEFSADNEICWFALFKFKYLNNITSHSIESIEKIEEYRNRGEKTLPEILNENRIIYDNGRILSAKKGITVYLTNVDYEIYKMFYEFEIDTIDEIYYMCSEKLPDYLIEPMKYYYKKKCILKKECKDETPEYVTAKALVNAFYGLCVQKFNETSIMYENGYIYKDNEYKTEGILSAMWGVWITAYARKQLLTMVKQIGDDVVYCDTDSIYMLNYDEHKQLIDNFNAEIENVNKCFDNEFQDIGCFDIIKYKKTKKYVYDKFKTLGAKRYIKTISGHTVVTIAGLPKQSLVKYANSKKIEIYDAFDDFMYIPVDYSNKNTSKYNDNVHEDDITDYTGQTYHMCSLSSMGIYEIDFTMNLNSLYSNLIEKYPNINV